MSYLTRDTPLVGYQRVKLRLQIESDGLAMDARAAFAAEGIATEAQEVVYVAGLDASRDVRVVAEVARGQWDSVEVPLPAMLAVVLLAGCDRMAIAHNHPSGPLIASAHDKELTAAVAAAANAVGIVLDDHLIYDPGGRSLSLRDTGVLGAPSVTRTEVRT